MENTKGIKSKTRKMCSSCFRQSLYGVLVINALKLRQKLKSRTLVTLLIHAFPSSPGSSASLKGNAELRRCVSAPEMQNTEERSALSF